MAYLHYDNVGIAAFAGAVPEFEQQMNTDPSHPRAAYIRDYIRQTGIQKRHISITEQTATDLGFAAIHLALERAGWTVDDLDALIFVGQTPDFNPGTGNAYVMHNHLKMRQDAFALDLAQGCAGFPYGLSVCASYLQQAGIRRIAMVSGDTIWPDYASKEELLSATDFLAGEGSIAILLEKRAYSPLALALYSDGSGYSFLYSPAVGARHAWRGKKGYLPNGEAYQGNGRYMDGLEITGFATMRVVESMKTFMVHEGTTINDYDGIILHQANGQIFRTICKRLKIGMDKCPYTLPAFANVNVASAPLSIISEYGGKTGKLKLLLSAFGIGLAWGIASFEIDASVIVPLATTNLRFDEDFIKPFENFGVECK